MLKFILGLLIFFIVYKTITYVKKALSSENKVSVSGKNKSNAKYNIDKEDIIDADFEEIKSQE